MVLTLSVGVSKIKNIKEFDNEQRTSNQTNAEVVPSIVKLEDFYVKLDVSLENKVYLKTYYHHN
jgi:hypothetical protein